jgi:hypothetical protein
MNFNEFCNEALFCDEDVAQIDQYTSNISFGSFAFDKTRPNSLMLRRDFSHQSNELAPFKQSFDENDFDFQTLLPMSIQDQRFTIQDDLTSFGLEGWDLKDFVELLPSSNNQTIDAISETQESKSHHHHDHSHTEDQKDESTLLEKASGSTPRIGCRCGMSKCLRLHCRCFRDLEYCAKNCKCTSCFNNLENEEVRTFIVNKTKEINRNAFKKKIVSIEKDDKNLVNTNGCTCKSGCNRNYCECFKNGTGCSPLCKCANCTNSILELPNADMKKMFKPACRQKKKLVFKDLQLTKRSDSNEDNESETLVSSFLTNCSDPEKDLTEDDRKFQTGNNAALQVSFLKYKRIRNKKVDS